MGRTAGSLNKNKDRLLRMIKEVYGDDFDPIMKMAEIASKEENEDSLKLQAWKEIAQYVYPKLKAIEVEVTGEMISVTEQRGVSEIILRVEELTVGRAEGDT